MCSRRNLNFHPSISSSHSKKFSLLYFFQFRSILCYFEHSSQFSYYFCIQTSRPIRWLIMQTKDISYSFSDSALVTLYDFYIQEHEVHVFQLEFEYFWQNIIYLFKFQLKNMNFMLLNVKILQTNESLPKETLWNAYRPRDQPTYRSRSLYEKIITQRCECPKQHKKV